INYDLPYNAEDYVHRIGRTGRAGASGDAISLYSDKENRQLADIEKLIKRKLAPQSLEGFSRRPHASARGQRDHSSRSERTASSHTSRREKVDPWFLKPYEPSETPVAKVQETPAAPPNSSTQKPVKRAALPAGKH